MYSTLTCKPRRKIGPKGGGLPGSSWRVFVFGTAFLSHSLCIFFFGEDGFSLQIGRRFVVQNTPLFSSSGILHHELSFLEALLSVNTHQPLSTGMDLRDLRHKRSAGGSSSSLGRKQGGSPFEETHARPRTCASRDKVQRHPGY